MPSRGRFQSFLFSRLSQHSLRLRDRLGRWMRQGQVAVTWGAQAALYPFYVGLQSLRMASRQLMPGRAAAPAERPPLLQRWWQRMVGQPASDTSSPELLLSSAPVLATLDLLEAWANRGDLHLMAADRAIGGMVGGDGSAYQGAIAPVPAQTPVPVLTIRGIASCLDRRTLVLITPENQRLQGLSKSQQAQLQRCMAEALAQAGYERPTPEPSLPSLGLPPVAERVLLPLRQFYHQLAQRQQGHGAIATHLFRRAALGLYFGAVDQPQAEPQPSIMGAIAPTQNPIRALLTAYRHRSSTLVPRAEAAMTSQRPAASEALSQTPLTSPSHPWQEGDWDDIDITAEFLGYSRHPLEQLLHWLDRGMLWLEERWAAFWQWWQERRSAPERPEP